MDMDIQLKGLPWLADAPADFRQQVKAAANDGPEARILARRLAESRLSGNQLHLLGNVVRQLAAQEPGVTRLGILSNATADFLLNAVAVSALRHGLWVQPIGTAFDQVATAALDSSSSVNVARCHFVLIAVDHRGLPLVAAPGDVGRARASLEDALAYIDSIRDALRKSSGCSVIVQSVPQIPDASFGSIERAVEGTLAWLIDHFNQELRARVHQSSDLLLDAAALAEKVGIDHWHDETAWTLGKFPFAHDVLPLYADWIARLIAAARGKARKCLVLDLDNTLWGGVVGDDGLEGIVLGNGSPLERPISPCSERP